MVSVFGPQMAKKNAALNHQLTCDTERRKNIESMDHYLVVYLKEKKIYYVCKTVVVEMHHFQSSAHVQVRPTTL